MRLSLQRQLGLIVPALTFEANGPTPIGNEGGDLPRRDQNRRIRRPGADRGSSRCRLLLVPRRRIGGPGSLNRVEITFKVGLVAASDEVADTAFGFEQ